MHVVERLLCEGYEQTSGPSLDCIAVATLGYSGATFVKFGGSEDLQALRAGLREVFDFFGGAPEHLLFYNPKTVVIDRDACGEGLHRWNEGLREVAEECGFRRWLCRAFLAKTKEKVERFNGYLKGSFLVPLAASPAGCQPEADCGGGQRRRAPLARRGGQREIGYCPSGGRRPTSSSRVAKRYELDSIVLTSNFPFTQWGGAFSNDQTMTAALLDRLLHHAHIV